MGETTNQIERYIENKREDLGSNVQELEQKVKSATDWRQQFQQNPLTLIGVAFGGGVLLATVMGGRERQRFSETRSRESYVTEAPHAATDHQKHKALETWDNIKGALIGVAATRFKDFVSEVVPGFEEQFRRTESQKSSSPSSSAVRSESETP